MASVSSVSLLHYMLLSTVTHRLTQKKGCVCAYVGERVSTSPPADIVCVRKSKGDEKKEDELPPTRPHAVGTRPYRDYNKVLPLALLSASARGSLSPHFTAVGTNQPEKGVGCSMERELKCHTLQGRVCVWEMIPSQSSNFD